MTTIRTGAFGHNVSGMSEEVPEGSVWDTTTTVFYFEVSHVVDEGVNRLPKGYCYF